MEKTKVSACIVTYGGYEEAVKAAQSLLQHTKETELSLYLVAEAPTWAGKAYDGYDYEELARAADHLVLRVGSYESHDDGFSTAPVSPLEEVYYALALLQDGKTSLARALGSPSGSSAPSVLSRDASGAYDPPLQESIPRLPAPGAEDGPEVSAETFPGAGAFSPPEEHAEPAASPAGTPRPLPPSRLPSLLGEVMTVILGTLRLYRARYSSRWRRGAD